MRTACAFLMTLILFDARAAISAPASADDVASLAAHLRKNGRKPADYLVAKTSEYRVVIVGENHWQRADAELIASIVPELRRRNVALAMEFFRASDQENIDRLIAGKEWDTALANTIMRSADWPYVEYRDILRAAWEAGRDPADTPMKVLALGPPADWRKLGISYDAFMADLVKRHAVDDQHRVLVYCGMHHAFTRYQQNERTRGARATEYMDRMGNILNRRFGQDTFLVALHKPEGCATGENAFAKLCAPMGGRIDCAAAAAGGNAVAFDVLGSPAAEWLFEKDSFYAIAHPLLRLWDYTDGVIWLQPVDRAAMVTLIPVDEYHAGSAIDEKTRAEWLRHGEDLAHPERRPNRGGLSDWRTTCKDQ